jgi:DNA adenine methylase
MKPPITYYGGKQLMARHILPLIPEHRLYAEPFFGGGAIFFGKPKSHTEVINDLNSFVVNFYQQLKDNFPTLQRLVQATLHSRDLYRRAKVMYDFPDLFDGLQKA